MNLNQLASRLGTGGSMPVDPSEISNPFGASPQIWENYWNTQAGAPTTPRDIPQGQDPSKFFMDEELPAETAVETEEVQETPEVPPVVETPVAQAATPAPVAGPTDVKSLQDLEDELSILFDEAGPAPDMVAEDRGVEFDYNSRLQPSEFSTYPQYSPTNLDSNVGVMGKGAMDLNMPSFPEIGGSLDDNQGMTGYRPASTIANTQAAPNTPKAVNPFGPGNLNSLQMGGYDPTNPMAGYKPEMSGYGNVIPLNLMRQGKR